MRWDSACLKACWSAREQLLDLELIEQPHEIELAMTIGAGAFAALKQRRRNLVGRSGCGICGIESLEQAIPPASAGERRAAPVPRGAAGCAGGPRPAPVTQTCHRRRARRRPVRCGWRN
ncbi:MAG: hypothetical protein MZW92_34445 [Comamonadaceae bacterium]|nr:hypothetical protein [Comamonadaceae bacterium]